MLRGRRDQCRDERTRETRISEEKTAEQAQGQISDDGIVRIEFRPSLHVRSVGVRALVRADLDAALRSVRPLLHMDPGRALVRFAREVQRRAVVELDGKRLDGQLSYDAFIKWPLQVLQQLECAVYEASSLTDELLVAMLDREKHHGGSGSKRKPKRRPK